MFLRNTNCILNGAMIDTGPNVVSSVRLPLVLAARISDMRNRKPVSGENAKRITDIGAETVTVEMLKCFFHFGGREYFVNSNILPIPTTFTVYHKFLHEIGMKYRTYYRRSIDQRMASLKRPKCETTSNSLYLQSTGSILQCSYKIAIVILATHPCKIKCAS